MTAVGLLYRQIKYRTATGPRPNRQRARTGSKTRAPAPEITRRRRIHPLNLPACDQGLSPRASAKLIGLTYQFSSGRLWQFVAAFYTSRWDNPGAALCLPTGLLAGEDATGGPHTHRGSSVYDHFRAGRVPTRQAIRRGCSTGSYARLRRAQASLQQKGYLSEREPSLTHDLHSCTTKTQVHTASTLPNQR